MIFNQLNSSPAMSPLRHRSVFGAKSAQNGQLRKVRFFVSDVKCAAWASKFARFRSKSSLLGRKSAQKSSWGPRPAINCFHTHTPPYICFHLPSSTLIFSSFFYIPFCPSHPFCSHHFSKFFAILFSFLLASFISPTALQNVISSISSPHPFQKNKFCKIYCKKCLSSKKIELSKNDLSISRTKNRTATTSLPSFVSSLVSYIFFRRGVPCRI